MLPLKPKRLVRNGLVAHYEPIKNRNLIKWSEDFSKSEWNKNNLTVSINNAITPDGNLTAIKITENTLNNEHWISQPISVIPNTVYSFSVFAKKGTNNWVALQTNIIGSYRTAYFNLDTGVVGTINSGITASIVNAGDGWYRCTIKATTGVNVTTSIIVSLVQQDNVLSYLGTGNYIYIWGAQLELNSSATTYQKTTDLQTLWNKKLDNVSVTNIVTNGNFASTSGWSTSTASFSVNNNTASVVATAQYGQIYKSITTNINNKYYVKANLKTDISNIVRLSVGSNYSSLHTGSNTYEKLSIIFTATSTSHSVVLFDNRTSNWNTFYVQ